MTFAAQQARTNTAVAAKLMTDAATLNGVAITGKFDNDYTEAFSIAGSSPALTAESADVSSAALGSAVVVNEINYTVAAIKQDGTGMTLLLLTAA
jgi:hypothetical protein